MESMPTKSNGSSCLSFWTQLLGNDTSIEVFIVKNGNNLNPANKVQSLAVTKGTKKVWTNVNIDIKPAFLINATEFSVRISGLITNPKSFIALDDVILTNQVCPSAAQSQFICSTGKILNITQVCNFVKDCPNSNDDELNCGACNFETGI